MSCAAALLTFASPVIAQTDGGPGGNAAPAANNVIGLEEVVVTAQRRAESAQSVPLSVQSFSGESLNNAGISSTEDLTGVVGSLVIQPTGTRPSLFLRGVGTNSSNTTPSVLTFIDGVYQPFGAANDLNNLASLEVLKGPQGTLFGRNATGGVIQLTTKDPLKEQGGTVEVGYGNYNTVHLSFYGATKLADNLAADLSVSYTDQQEGFGTNVFNGDEVFLTERLAIRSKWVYQATDNFRVTAAADYLKSTGTVGSNVSPAVGYRAISVAGGRQAWGGSVYPGTFDLNADFDPHTELEEYGGSLTLDYDLGGMLFKSISAYRRQSELIQIDYDGTSLALFNLRIPIEPRKAFTQELQLISDNTSSFNWVVGAYYFDMTNELKSPWSFSGPISEAIFGLPPGGRYEMFARDYDTSLSVYGQGSYALTPATRLTIGARYTMEDRGITGRVEINGGARPIGVIPGTAGSLSKTFKEPTYRVALDHKLTDNILVYGSYSRGFNTGFYNRGSVTGYATEAQNPLVEPELLEAYELGLKSDLLDRRLRVNLSVFTYDYQNLQQQIYQGGAVNTVNAAGADIKGIDFEITARPIPSLVLSLSGTYLDATYSSYPDAPNYVMLPDAAVVPVGSISAKGKMITQTPELSYTVSASHVLNTSMGEFTTSANLNYRGKMYADPFNRFEVPTRYVLNLSEHWKSSDGRYLASIWANNILDERYDYTINILTPAGLIGLPAPPRTFGATIGMKF